MKYKNANSMLPAWLLEKIQDYVQGEIIYIPKKEAARAGWGATNGTRERYIQRNKEIMAIYKDGTGINELSQKYGLSDDSIRKILNAMRELEYEVSR